MNKKEKMNKEEKKSEKKNQKKKFLEKKNKRIQKMYCKITHSNRTVINKNTPKPTEKSHRFQYFVFFLFKIPCIL